MRGTHNPRIGEISTRTLQSEGNHTTPMPPKVSLLIFVESFLSKYFKYPQGERLFITKFKDTSHKLYNSMTFLVMQICYIMKKASLFQLRSMYYKQ